ncbi:hypothetical protein C1645_830272 [Glomus cerebriforme]|uniref:hAT-like transposase RNase-H fold domain-containing protein n=1 Tax=Glomus cerebriforme TaxID=658196 RepID=A0A397SLM1_9GLOM|nr:hypothetical protein C1645_830272 [Glomus cerebriforme]
MSITTKSRAKLLEYYNKTNDACIIVTILDSRFKMDYYNDEIWNDDQRKEICEKFLKFYNTDYSLNSNLIPSRNLVNENLIISQIFKKRHVNEVNEFQVYFLSSTCDANVDPLQ